MLTSRYMTSVKNVPAIMQKIVDGSAPTKFTISHLKGLGFKSSNDLGVIPLLKDLEFLTSDGSPTPQYHAYRDKSQSKQVLGVALKRTYEDLFHINENISEADRQAIVGRFKSTHNVTDRVAELQALTFLTLLKMADIAGSGKTPAKAAAAKVPEKLEGDRETKVEAIQGFSGLRYNIEVHLPATKDVEVYNSIFKSLKEHLLDD